MAEQKRSFVRLDVVLPVRYRSYTGNPVMEQGFNVGRTLNLSSGGMLLVVPKPLPTGAKLDLGIEIGDGKILYVPGRVLSGSDQTLEGIVRREEKIAFVDVDEETQDAVMRFILEEQRRQKRQRSLSHGEQEKEGENA